MKRAILVLAIALISACGSDTPPGTAATEKAPLFRAWSLISGNFNMDLSGMGIGTNAVSFYLLAGATCEADIIIAGDGRTGGMSIVDSTYSGLGVDPGCVGFNGTYTYTATATSLVICQGADCSLQFN